jgi:hypothetical protein
MSVLLSPFAGAGQQFFDNNGNVLSGGKIYTYAAGTTTPAATYTSNTGLTPNANPIVLDSAGRLPNQVWLTSGAAYKFVLNTSADVTLGTFDNVPGVNDFGTFTASGGAALIGATDGAGGVNWTTVQGFIDDIISPSGSSYVGYTQGGTNAATRTIQSKLRDVVSVKDFGAVGNGITNDTTAIQSAVNASSAVYFPAGTYLTNTITLDANSLLYGDGPASIIKQNTITGASYGTLYCNSGASGSTLDNIIIRDLRVEGPNIAAPVFSEFQHLISLNGVRNAIIERVQLIGFRGDGVYIGSGVVGGDERHNYNVVVRNCFFDGINKENRNSISVIDCDGFWAEENYFTRSTKSTMPGPIDIEPDAYIFHTVKNINILYNKFFDTGGNIAAISVYLPGVTYTTPPLGFLIQGNFIENCAQSGVLFYYAVTGGISELTANFSIRILGNTVKTCWRGFNLLNCKDLVLADNTVISATNHNVIGEADANINMLDIIVTNNMFYECGTVSGNGMVVYKCSRLQISGNTFKDCGAGTPGASNALLFDYSTSSYVSITDNVFTTPAGVTLIAIQKEAAHTFTPSTNTFLTNVLSGLGNSFDWRKGDVRLYSAAPATGAWEITDYVYNSAPASGAPRGWVCTVAGTPGTWNAMANLA